MIDQYRHEALPGALGEFIPLTSTSRIRAVRLMYGTFKCTLGDSCNYVFPVIPHVVLDHASHPEPVDPLPTGDVYTLEYIAAKLDVIHAATTNDPWYAVKDERSVAIIKKLDAVRGEIEALTGIPAIDREDAL